MIYVLVFAAGFAAAIFTWPKIKLWINGAKSEADALKAKADELLKKL